MPRTHQIKTLENMAIARCLLQHLPLMRNRPHNNAILLFKVKTLNASIELLQRLDCLFLVVVAGVEPGRLGDEDPADNHERDGGPDDAHGEEVVVGVFLVELLHHDGDDDAADVAPFQNGELKMRSKSS